MATSNVHIRFEAERNNGGIGSSITTDDRTVVVLKLSASELEELVQVINDALDDQSGDGGGSALHNGQE